MGNCLKTQLKESVNNDALLGIGSTGFKVQQKVNPSENQCKLEIQVMLGNVKVIAKGSGSFVVNGVSYKEKEITPEDNLVVFTFTNDNYYVEITNKKYIRILNIEDNDSIFKFELTNFDYLDIITSLVTGKYTSGDIKCLKNAPALSIINMADSQIIGNIEELKTLSILRNAYFSNTAIYGNIDDLGSINTLQNFIITGTNVTGTIEGFVEKAVLAENSGNYGIGLGIALPLLTFNGKLFTEANNYPIFVFWENNGSKIYVSYGSRTIDPNTTATIYCKGYTQAEAEAKWPSFASNRIIRVDA